MSTKVYGAYKLKTGSIFKLMDVIKQVRKRYFDEVVVKEMLQYYENGKWKSWSELVDFSRDEMRKGLNSPLNFVASVVVYFFEEQIFFQVFDNRASKMICVELGDNIRDYSYWNNSDQDEEVSSEDWDERERVWDGILTGAGVPSECGLSYDFFNHNNTYSLYRKDILEKAREISDAKGSSKKD